METIRLFSIRRLAVLILFACVPAHAQEFPLFEAKGLLFGDIYHIPSHHTDEGEGATGAVLRRGYVTFDTEFNELWTGRLRFELNQSGEFEDYDFEVDVKDLFVARDIGEHKLVLGLSPTPTYALIESIWGLRYLMRTPMDLQGVASRDTGVAMSGPVTGDSSVFYRVMLGAGTEFGNETGDGRKVMGALAWELRDNFYLEAHLDHEKLTGPTDRTTYQVFAGYDTEALRWGIQYSNQDRQDDPPLELASAFVVRPWTSSISLIGRVDHLFEPSPSGDNISYIPFDPSAEATMFLGAVEFKLTPHFHLIPNIIYTRYDENNLGETPDSDMHLRLTFFLNYE